MKMKKAAMRRPTKAKKTALKKLKNKLKQTEKLKKLISKSPSKRTAKSIKKLKKKIIYKNIPISYIKLSFTDLM